MGDEFFHIVIGNISSCKYVYIYIYIYVYILAVSQPSAGLPLVPAKGIDGFFGSINFWGIWPKTYVKFSRFAQKY